MDGETERSWSGRWQLVWAAVVFVGVAGWAATGLGQDNPTEATAGPRPSVTILLDSSASMEWTQEGEGQYPKRLHPQVHDKEDPYPLQPEQYSPEYSMGIHAKDQWDRLGDGSDDDLDEWEQYNEYIKDWKNKCPESPSADSSNDWQDCNPIAFGSCVVWEPPCEPEDDATDDGEYYERPSWSSHPAWTPNYYADQEWKGTEFEHDYDDEATEMGRRFRRYVRGRESKWDNLDDPPPGGSDNNEEEVPLRLLNASQPRHVTLKEVMAGEMVLKPYDRYENTRIENLDASVYGPGCWFVPRQRGMSGMADPVPPCCKESEGSGPDDFTCTETYEAYERYPDSTDPRPHMQEVYDGRKSNGLMDNLINQVHFSVASFDSFKYPMDGDEWASGEVDETQTVRWNPNHINDRLASMSDLASEGDDNASARDYYNLGVYRIVGAVNLPSDEQYVVDANNIAETALVDTGTLKYRAYEDDDQEVNDDERQRFDIRTRERDDDYSNPLMEGELLDDSPNVPKPLDFQLEEDTGEYIGSTLMSRQPITGSTPLAPAMFDLHDYYLDMATEGQGFRHDDANECRPKHVVTLTDGIPLPEAPPEDSSSICEEVDTQGLGEAFNMNSDKYDYMCTERHINEFVTDTTLEGEDSRYSPRVHVISPAIQAEGVSEEQSRKLASMAREGKTCAGWYLGDGNRPEECSQVDDDEWIPEDPGTENPCPADDHPCLVKQYDDGDGSPSFSPYDDPNGNCLPSGYTCDYPALILQCNRGDSVSPDDYRACRSGEWYSQAMQQVFNGIVKTSGLQSRTTPAISNELDNPGRGNNLNGQYRMYSGTDVEATNPVWRGVLYRETRMCQTNGELNTPEVESPCDSSNDNYHCFHQDIERQVRPSWSEDSENDGLSVNDTRRLFTSVPSAEIYDYDENKATPDNPEACEFYHTSYHMQSTDSGDGEFGDTYLEEENDSGELAEVSNNDALVGSRVPFELDELSAAVGEALSDDDDADESVAEYFNVSDDSSLQTLIDKVRGRHPSRQGRVLGAILNSDPVAVEPPKLDLPIDSYRKFKTRFSQRASMLFFGTLDGMIHGLYTGVLADNESNYQVKVRNDEDGDDVTNGPAEDQREAWSYLPQILHKNYVDEHGTQDASSNPKMMNGAPTVQDVRLCHADPKYNQNVQACRGICDDTTSGLCSSGGDCEVPPAMQWRTVMVQGMGNSGPGYVALDITRPGGPDREPSSGDDEVKLPDPVPLWEFGPDWERGQVEHMLSEDYYDESKGEQQVCGPTGCDDDDIEDLLDDDDLDIDIDEDLADDCEDDFFEEPRLSKAVSKPAIGTVLMPPIDEDEDGAAKIRRPIAVFGGGNGQFYGADDDCEGLAGRGIYVVDLQTGSILRRFVGAYEDSAAAESGGTDDYRLFESPVLGSPLLYDGSPGNLVTRGFIGDGAGRLYRMDFTGADPSDWTVTEFYDPTNDEEDRYLSDDYEPSDLGGAYVQPSAALSRNGNLVVVYGLGQPGDGVSTDQANGVIALREDVDGEAEELWIVEPDGDDETENFKEGEKLTGKPIIFNQGVYFTSFYHRDDDSCASGNSRIWGLGFGDDLADEGADVKPDGLFDCDLETFDDVSACHAHNFEPKEDVLVQGLEITMPPSCAVDPSQGGDGSFGYTDSGGGGGNGGEPQLVAQTGGADPGTGNVGSSSQSDNFVNRMEVGRDVPESQFIPMSWSIVNQ